MELKEFVADALIQIQEGVEDAIRRRQLNPVAAGAINPVWGTLNKESAQPQLVEFDVAVTVSDTVKGGGGGKLRVAFFELNGEGAKTAERSTVSRIAFKIPFIPPAQLVKEAT